MKNHPQTSPASLKRQNVQLYRFVWFQRDIFPVKHVKALRSAASQNQPTLFSADWSEKTSEALITHGPCQRSQIDNHTQNSIKKSHKDPIFWSWSHCVYAIIRFSRSYCCSFYSFSCSRCYKKVNRRSEKLNHDCFSLSPPEVVITDETGIRSAHVLTWIAKHLLSRLMLIRRRLSRWVRETLQKMLNSSDGAPTVSLSS